MGKIGSRTSRISGSRWDVLRERIGLDWWTLSTFAATCRSPSRSDHIHEGTSHTRSYYPGCAARVPVVRAVGGQFGRQSLMPSSMPTTPNPDHRFASRSWTTGLRSRIPDCCFLDSHILQGVSKLRNRVVGGVFRELHLIEQWGSGSIHFARLFPASKCGRRIQMKRTGAFLTSMHDHNNARANC